MSLSPAFCSLQDTDRLLVTGASGWLGREVILRLRRGRPDIPVLGVASRPRETSVGQETIVAQAWDHVAISEWAPTVVVHLAYLTRELEQQWGPFEYERQNQELSDRAARLYALPSLRGFVIASSGAAVSLTDQTYGRLKAEDEQRFLELAQTTGVPTVAARIWSVSGPHCRKPSLFALFDLIHQTRQRPVVRIQAAHEVWRRYVDAGEYLEVCLGAVGVGHSGVIDSGGEKVEIGDLALHVQEVLDIKRPIERPPIVGAPDGYYSDSLSMVGWAQRLGIPLSGLTEQIRRSAAAVI